MVKSLPFVDLKAQYARIEADIRAGLDRVLAHGRYVMGPEIEELEAALADFCGAGHAVTCASGTVALQIPLMAEGIGPGDAVFVPAFTFVASAEVILSLGATPVFVDVDPESFNIDPADLERRIAAVRLEGRLTPRAAIAVDLFGRPADHPALAALCARHGLFLLDDAAQGFGGAIGERRIGAWGDACATSFFPAKPLGCYGDGGAILTDDPDKAHIFRSIRNHGAGDDRYDIVRLGMNGRLDTMQAAVLLAKLRIFEDELEARDALARHYDRRLAGAVRIPARMPGARSAWAQYTIRLGNRDRVKTLLQDAGVPTAVYYPLPMHLQPAYVAYASGAGACLAAEALCNEVLSLPMHPYMTSADADYVCDRVLDAVAKASAEAA